jgi:hypothetical protein
MFDTPDSDSACITTRLDLMKTAPTEFGLGLILGKL